MLSSIQIHNKIVENRANLNAAIQDETFDEDYEIEKHEMKLERIVIDGQSKFLGKSLMESGIRDEFVDRSQGDPELYN